MRYVQKPIWVEPETEKEFERRLKKAGISKSEFYRRAKGLYLSKGSLPSPLEKAGFRE